MRDEDKSREQLLKELREIRQRNKDLEADALSDQTDSDQTRDRLTAALSKSAMDLKASRAETATGKEKLAESQESLRLSEQNLAAFHERYNILGDLIPFGIWTADAKGNITFLSDAFLEMSGITIEESGRLEWVDQLARPVVKNAISEWSSDLRQRDIWEREFAAVSEAGKNYDILIRGVPILDDKDNILSWLGINLDISQRKRAEENLHRHKEKLEELVREQSAELAHSENLYRSIAANLPHAAAFIVDADLRYLLAEGSALREAGMEPADLEGKTIYETLPRELADMYEPSYRSALAGNSVSTEHAAHGKHYLSYIVPIVENGGRIHTALAVSYDITERKQAEEALRKAKIQAERESARTRAILDSIAEGVVVADSDGNFIEMNSAGLSIHEFDNLDEIRRHLMEYPDLFEGRAEDGSFIPVEDWPMSKALHGEVFTGYELWVTRKDTGTKWIGRYSGAPVRDSDGNIFMAVITLEDITERKQAERAIRESEARYRELVQNANSAIIRWKADGTLTFFNEYAQAFFGYSADEVIGKHVGMLVPQEDSTGADLSDLVRDVVANPEQYVNFVNENVRKDGSRAWMSWTNKPIFDTEGKVIEILAVGTDITERKRAEEALRESEEKFRSVFENSSLGIFRSTMEGLFLDVNPAIARMLGYDSPGELKREIGSIGAQLYVHPEQRKEIVRRLAAEGEVLDKEVQYRRKDGVIVTGRLNVKAVRDGSGRVTHLEGFVDDITEQKHLEEELRKSEQRFRLLFENAPLPYQSLDERGYFLDVNKRWLEVLGYAREEVIGKWFGDFLDPKHVQDFDRNFPIFKDACVVDDAEFVMVRKDGGTITAQFNGRVQSDNSGTFQRTHCIFTDMTDRKRMEQNLRNLASELEERVRARTADLERANRAKDEFLANMSHEIRTPMAGVLGLTEILLHQESPAKMQRDLELIHNSANSVMSLLNDLFDLSRINQAKLEFHPTQFDPREAVRDSLGPFEFQAKSKELEFILAFDESVPPMILCDRERLAQVIKNLVSNAIKFTDQGFVRIDIRAEERNLDTLLLFVAVSDTGIGIPASKHKDIFDAFTQLDPSYSKQYNGMGLGLAISKSLVEGMGGEITVSSTQGRGATFGFYIPCAKAAKEHKPVASGIGLSDLPPMTILLAEDNAVNRIFLRRALVTAGHKVGEAEDGKHALAKLGDSSYDLVLMDIQMPEMDGVEATRRIRSGKHGRADIPIIALTAYAMKGDREKFLENGMGGYVAKPVDFGELARTIAEVLGILEAGH
jgi:PAS domain S-box-containing protein